MSIIIDGYNLWHASGILAKGLGPGGLERARNALVGFLAASLAPEVRCRTTVVFDAAGGSPDLPHSTEESGITIRFAAEHDDADSLIEEMILRDSAPRRLTVVSSDRRLQRAARRRRSRAVDSRTWYDEIVRERLERNADRNEQPAKPSAPPTSDEVAYWLHEFGGEPRESDSQIDNPFPPGYGEDLLEDD